jgi:serine/threonine-protein kinase HipA
MKLAVAVGANRHYVIDEIMPRHFVQTAAKSAVTESDVDGIFDEIARDEQSAVGKTLEALPAGFPKALVRSIVGGLRSRLARATSKGVKR